MTVSLLETGRRQGEDHGFAGQSDTFVPILLRRILDAQGLEAGDLETPLDARESFMTLMTFVRSGVQ